MAKNTGLNSNVIMKWVQRKYPKTFNKMNKRNMKNFKTPRAKIPFLTIVPLLFLTISYEDI